MMPDNTPILIGASQLVLRDTPTIEAIKSPIELAADAVNTVLTDINCPELVSTIDTLIMTRLLIDSAAGLKHPFGSSSKPPLSVIQRTQLNPQHVIYANEGGQSPQRLVNEFAAKIFQGKISSAVICGAEATAAMKQALKKGWALDWSDDPSGVIEDRGCKPLMDELELKHHITFPPQVYALFENAWRHEHQLNITEHRKVMGKLFSAFSRVAAENPFAQFPVAHSAEFLATPSPENYAFNEPYNKWMIAQDAVNQASALVLTSVGNARKLGIPENKWLYLHGYADADDAYVSRRVDMASSIAMKAVSQCALSMANKNINDIEHLDLYSCFPIAVLAACDALGLPWDNGRDLTVTGGLPFFGGPGNTYSLHAIAEMYSRLTHNTGHYGFVLANGGYLSKQSVGIYSTTPCENWRPVKGNTAQEMVDDYPKETVLYPYEGEALIESYSLVYKRSEPAIAFIVGRDKVSDQRILAKASRGDAKTLQEILSQEPIGRTVAVTSSDKGAYFTFSD
jgi:acetyl-CoA C-acetyltransferase